MKTDVIKILREVLDKNKYYLVENIFELNRKFSFKFTFLYFLMSLFKFNILNYRIKKILKKRSKLYLIFKLFYQNQKILKREALLIFTQNNLDLFLKEKILKEVNGFVLSDYSIMPYKRKYFLIDNFYAKKKKYYVGTGIISLIFLNKIKEYLDQRQGVQEFTILDVGTGPGTLAIGLVNKVKSLIGCDINPRAINLAKINMILNKVSNKKIKFIKSDYRKLLKKSKFDLIISNLPSLPVPNKIRKNFPLCDYGGENGLEFTLDLVKSFIKSKNNKLAFIILSGGNQSIKIVEYLKKYKLKIKIYILSEFSAYHYLYNIKNVRTTKIMLEHLRKNDISRFYIAFLIAEKGHSQIKIKTIYKLPRLIKFLEEKYFKFMLSIKLLSPNSSFPT